MKLRTFMAVLTTVFLLSAAYVIKRAIDERRKPPPQHALVDDYMWIDTPTRSLVGNIILAGSKDTSVCWISAPCDSAQLYKWHVKEIQRMQKKRLWGSLDDDLTDKATTHRPVTQKLNAIYDTSNYTRIAIPINALVAVDTTYLKSMQLLKYMEFQNEAQDPWYMQPKCDTCIPPDAWFRAYGWHHYAWYDSALKARERKSTYPMPRPQDQ